MNDRFLFRGKSCMGNWVYGYLKKQLVGGEPELWAIQSYEGCPVKNQSKCSGIQKLYENIIDPATVGQCTGIRDKNRELIFEGDIIFHHHPEDEYKVKGVVKYEVCWGGFYFAGNRGMNTTTTYEILGNIHDNPELMKKNV